MLRHIFARDTMSLLLLTRYAQDARRYALLLPPLMPTVAPRRYYCHAASIIFAMPPLRHLATLDLHHFFIDDAIPRCLLIAVSYTSAPAQTFFMLMLRCR